MLLAGERSRVRGPGCHTAGTTAHGGCHRRFMTASAPRLGPRSYAACSINERPRARALLVSALSSQLALAGSNLLRLPCSARAGRFCAPEPAALVAQPIGIAFAPPAPGRLLPHALRVKEVCAGDDFAVLLAFDGSVVDTRCLPTTPMRSALPAAPDLPSGVWQPPCCRAVAVAAGGCWRGVGRAGGHVLVLTSAGSVWAFGGNAAGQLGCGHAVAADGFVTAPVEVVSVDRGTAMGGVTAVAAGDMHSALLTASGRVFAAGSNIHGACGQPLPLLHAEDWLEAAMPAGCVGARLSCGGLNTAVVTAAGRLLVCGSNEWGQACVGAVGGALHALTDVGPSVRAALPALSPHPALPPCRNTASKPRPHPALARRRRAGRACSGATRQPTAAAASRRAALPMSAAATACSSACWTAAMCLPLARARKGSLAPAVCAGPRPCPPSCRCGASNAWPPRAAAALRLLWTPAGGSGPGERTRWATPRGLHRRCLQTGSQRVGGTRKHQSSFA